MAAQGFAISISHLKEEDDSLGEKANQLIKLQKAEFLIPQTFIVTPKAYFEFIKHNDLDKKIGHLLGVVDLEKAKSVKDVASYIEKYVTKSAIPDHVLKEILDEYKKLGGILSHSKANVFLSHIKNGLETHKITGDASLIDKIKNHWFSIYSPVIPKTNPTLIIQNSVEGKNGKIRTSTKQINTSFDLSKLEVGDLENIITKFKKSFYFPHEIDWVINNKDIYIIKIKPETENKTNSFLPETHFTITRNSNHHF